MKYCNRCGQTVSLRKPPGDERERFVCDACDTVHYLNPRIVTGCVAEWKGRILMCRRAIKPRYGFWTVPAGFLELGETIQAGAKRETREEAGARIEIDALFTTFSLSHIGQVYMLFRGRLLEPRFGPSTESLESALLAEGQIPWEELAFPVVRETLALYFRDRRAGRFGIHTGEILRESPDFSDYQVTMM